MIIDHKCQYPECVYLKISGSDFCHCHKCQYSDQFTFCVKLKFDNHIYCLEHVNVGVGLSFKCDLCNASIMYGSRFCANHTCKHETCNGFIDDECINEEYINDYRVKQYCNIHACSRDDCFGVKQQGFDVCSKHICHFENCGRLLYYHSELYCQLHACSFYDCDQSKNSTSKYCDKHMCAYPNCHQGSANNYASTGCEEHTCHYSAYYCQIITVFGSNFCQKHTCSCDNCFVVVEECSAYCGNHKCTFLHCSEKKLVGRICCQKHTCSVENCCNIALRNEHNFTFGYCTDHSCNYLDNNMFPCYSKKIIGQNYCDKHKCQFCEKHIIFDETTCCENHKCKHKKCAKTVVENQQFCISHCCPGCGKGKKTLQVACGIDCENSLYGFMYEITHPTTEQHYSGIHGFVSNGTIFMRCNHWNKCAIVNKLVLKCKEIYVCEHLHKCTNSDCSTLTDYPDFCRICDNK